MFDSESSDSSNEKLLKKKQLKQKSKRKSLFGQDSNDEKQKTKGKGLFGKESGV
jgi:hypothetical protein